MGAHALDDRVRELAQAPRYGWLNAALRERAAESDNE
jgi:hypothetical protein